MKGMKKLLSILMVLTLVLSLGATALAVDITITDENSAGSTYGAYRLLDLTTTATAGEGTTGYAYTVNETYRDVLKQVTGQEKDEDIIKYISELKGAAVQKFADDVFAKIKDMSPDLDWQSEKTFTDVEQGYYLIVEKVADGTVNGATSLVMLDTAGRENVDVTTKEEKPESKKKVKETDDYHGTVTDWQDGADYDIGDMIPYRLSAKIPTEHYVDYETYYLQFVDDMCKGLGEPEDVKIYWVGADGTEHDITSAFTGPTKVSEPASKYDGGTVYTWTCPDIKAAGVTEPGATVYVEYESELTADAVIGGAGNPNDSHIVYSDNPYGEGTSRTPDDKVAVFTFTIQADKVDGDDQPLEGAGFTLLKEVTLPEGSTATEVTYEQLAEKATGDYVKYNGKNYVVAHEQITGQTSFKFEGQDSGKYLLVETTVPDGYNKAEDVEFEVIAEYDTESDNPKLTGLKVTPDNGKFTCTPTDGTVLTDVVNQTGVELPETGGIGTTIFYIVGAVLVAGAVILLVTKKRVSGMEK